MDQRPDTYRCWARSHCGLVRSRNEDAFAVSALANVADDWVGSIPHEGWALLADGMGGHAAGRAASQLAIECLKKMAYLFQDDEGIENALSSVNCALFAAMKDDATLDGMGTTVAGVVLRPNSAICFNVGDSRIYHYGTKLTLVSEDHVVDGNVLTQCLGGWSKGDPVFPAIVEIEWKGGQRLLLCSDGLTDMLSDAVIADALKANASSPADALVEAALVAGGHDNVTVIVIEKIGLKDESLGWWTAD